MPTVEVRLDRDDIGERIDFACRLQALLDIDLGQPAPLCPVHDISLNPARVGDEVRWICPRDDFQCGVGEYELAAFWPLRQADRWAAPLLAKRFDERSVNGLSHFSVEERDGRLIARVAARPDAEESAVRAAASPLLVELSRVPAISTVREWRPATARSPAHEVLALTGVAIRGARLDGVLRRALPGDACDFLVGDTRVRLAATHVIGDPGGPLLLDGNGVPFADDGDHVSCGGGSAPRGPVRGEVPVFSAGQICVYRDEAAPALRRRTRVRSE